MSAEELVKGASKLISLPEICIRLNEVLSNPNHHGEQIADLISHDPSLTARLLRIVNSAYYNFPSKIERVSRAVSIIGEDDLRNMVLATSIVDVMNRFTNELVDIELFWLHSVSTGIVARLLARHCNVLHGERLFIAGLLHDIGKLIIYHQEPALSQQILLEAGNQAGQIHEAERSILGYTHAEVGGALIREWKLPGSLEEVVEHHHDPENAQNFPIETSITHIANNLINAMAPDMPLDEHILDDYPKFNSATLEITHLAPAIFPKVIEQAQEQSREILQILFPVC